MRVSSTPLLPIFRAVSWGVFVVGIGLFALRLRSYSRLPTVPVVITANAQETTYKLADALEDAGYECLADLLAKKPVTIVGG